MKHEDMDRILAQAAQRDLPPDEGRAAIERARSMVVKDLQRVRPLAPIWVFTLGLVAVFAAIGVASASVLGLHGLHALSPIQRALIFATLLATAWWAALGSAREMRPAAGSQVSTLALVVASGIFPALFSMVFRGYSTLNFIPEGIPCLVAGMCVAVPTGLVIAFILRRGFVMNWAATGVAAGTLAGLAGLAMLELHCPNLKAIHVMVWHVAVVVLSGVVGWVTGLVADHLRRGSIRQQY
jgi:hypothetical protein